MLILKRLLSTVLFTAILLTPTLSAETVLLFQPEGTDFNAVFEYMQFELGDEITIEKVVNKDDLTPKEIATAINRTNPKALILMNNNNIRGYRAYLDSRPDGEPALPSVSLMGTFINKEIPHMENAMAISYEVPIVTSVIHLREVLDIENVKLGIVYRDLLRDFIKDNSAYCKQEGIELQSYYVPEGETRYEKVLQIGLTKLAERDSVNVIWVPNDKVFLTKSAIETIWRPFSEKYQIPVIVGVENFVMTAVNFGTFAVTPDHASMGQQAANLLFTLKEDNWEVKGPRLVELPISIFKVLNLQKAKSHLDTTKILNVDKVVQ